MKGFLLVISLLFFDTAFGSAMCSKFFSEKLKLDNLKIAAVQFEITGAKDFADLLRRVEEKVREAKSQNANLIIFPELITVDLMPYIANAEQESLLVIAREYTTKYFSFVKSLRDKYKISILGGSSPRELKKGKIVNTAILALEDGQTILQDKIFLTADEVDWQWTPGTQLNIFHAPWGKSAILICYDCEFPFISNLIAIHQPEVILVPSMTGSKVGFNRVRWSAQARAIEHFSYIVHTGTVMTSPNIPEGHWGHYGQASFLGPQEAAYTKTTVEGTPNIPSIVYDTLDMKALREGREKARIYPAREQNKRTAPIEVSDDIN